MSSTNADVFSLLALAKYAPLKLVSVDGKVLRKGKGGGDYEVFTVTLESDSFITPVHSEMFKSQIDDIKLIKLAGKSDWFNVSFSPDGKKTIITGAIRVA